MLTLKKQKKTIVMDNNQLMKYDTFQKSFQTLFTTQPEDIGDAQAPNEGRFAISPDERTLAYVDNYTIATLDMETGEVVTEMARDQNESCAVRRISMIQDGKYFIAQTDSEVMKYETGSCTLVKNWKTTGEVYDIHVEESRNRVLILFSPKAGVYTIWIVDLINLEFQKKVGQSANIQEIMSFHYSSANSLLICNRQKTRILKFFEVDPEFTKVDNATVLESIETEENAPIVEHVARKILFVGGIKSLIVLDLPRKTIIARFYFSGNVKSIFLSKCDHGGIHVLSKVPGDKKSQKACENRFHKITFDSVVFRPLENKNIRSAVAMCLDRREQDAIYVAVNDGKTISRLSLEEQDRDLAVEQICHLQQEASTLLLDS